MAKNFLKPGGYYGSLHCLFLFLGYCSVSDIAFADVIPAHVTTPINTPIEIDFSASITNITDPKITIATSPNYGTAAIHPDLPLTIIYTPNLDYEGVDNFVYQVVNNSGVPEKATVTVVVGSSFIGFRITDSVPNSPLYSNMHLIDLDGDHDFDLVGETGTPAQVLWNKGNGEFTDSPFQPLHGSAFGDIDNDGDIDSVTFSLETFKNDGNGVFYIPPPQPIEPAPIGGGTQQETLKAMALGDLDKDGDLDAFIVTNQAGHIALNNGQGEFTKTPVLLGNADSTTVKLADLDCDADVDAFVANKGINAVWMNDGSGNFTMSSQPFSNGYNTSAVLGDLDNDGDVDALVFSAYPDQYQIWLNDGDGGFYSDGEPVNTSSYIGSPILGDIDNDGDLDIIFDFLPDLSVPSQTRFIAIYLNSGTGNFGFYSFQPISDGLSYIDEQRFTTVGDVDGDHYLDLIVGSFPNKVIVNELPQTRYSLLQFKQKTFRTSENATIATITLSRSGGRIGALSVHYTTMDNTATAGNDYLPASGDLYWEDGDMSDKHFSVEILADNITEGDESLTISLSGLMGGAKMDSETTELVISESNQQSPQGRCNIPRNNGNDTLKSSNDSGGGALDTMFLLVSAIALLFLMRKRLILHSGN